MREIEFRGKENKTNKWVYGDLLSYRNYKKPKNGKFIAFFNTNITKIYEMHRVNPKTIGQFTGLTDKNGNKIFEGDIITADYYPFIDNGKQNYVGIIEYIDELSSFEYILQCVNSEKRGISNGINEELEGNEDLICEDFEVIGNIYDDPELLEVEDD